MLSFARNFVLSHSPRDFDTHFLEPMWTTLLFRHGDIGAEVETFVIAYSRLVCTFTMITFRIQ